MSNRSGIGSGTRLALTAVTTAGVLGGGLYLAASGRLGPSVQSGLRMVYETLGGGDDTFALSAPTDVGGADDERPLVSPTPLATEAVEADVAEPTQPPMDVAVEHPAPVLDLVRIEPDGSGLIAGSGLPGSSISVMLDGAEIESLAVPVEGEFAAFITITPSDVAQVLWLTAMYDDVIVPSDEQFILAPAVAQVAQDDGTNTPVTDSLPMVNPADETTIAETTTDTVQADEVSATDAPAPELAGAMAPDGVAATLSATETAQGAAAAEEIAPVNVASASQVEPQQEVSDTSGGATLDAAAEVAETVAASTDRAEAAEISVPAGTAETEIAAVDTSTEPTSVEVALTPKPETKPEPQPEPQPEPKPESASGAAPAAVEVAIASPAAPVPVNEPKQSPTSVSTTPTSTTQGAANIADTTAATQSERPSGAEQAALAEDAVIADTQPAPKPAAAISILRADKDGVSLVQSATQPAPELLNKIALDTISYSDAGEVQLAGRATPQALVRVYLDNTPVVDFATEADGRWSGNLTSVAPGIYMLRLDEIDPIAGKVLSRLETPFKREAPEALLPVAQENAPGEPSVAVRAITVQSGDTLWAISQDRYGTGFLYVRVFEANKDAIRDPDLIYPGQIFTLPE